MMNVNKIIPFKEILRYGWYHATHYTRRSFDVYLTRLRKYLKDDNTLSLITYKGEGVALEYKQENYKNNERD
jgi:DNA-binding response OmpR family regulator